MGLLSQGCVCSEADRRAASFRGAASVRPELCFFYATTFSPLFPLEETLHDPLWTRLLSGHDDGRTSNDLVGARRRPAPRRQGPGRRLCEHLDGNNNQQHKQKTNTTTKKPPNMARVQAGFHRVVSSHLVG